MLKTDKALYLVETQEDYDNLMVELEKTGVVWRDGKRPTKVSYWESFKEKTVIELNGGEIGCSSIITFLAYNYSGYTFENYKKPRNDNRVKLKSSEKFVADWYEEYKDDFEKNIVEVIAGNYSWDLDDDCLSDWLFDENNKPLQTLVNMHQFGYEIEKTPLYTVELPNPNGSASFKLIKWGDKVILSKKSMMKSIFDNPIYHLTEDEIKKDFGWAWQFAKEVE